MTNLDGPAGRLAQQSARRVLELRPGQWTPLPGTNLAVLWEGEHPVPVRRNGHIWDLSPLSTRPGVVQAWARVLRHGRPVTPPWPLLPLVRPATYRTAAAGQPDAPAGPRLTAGEQG